MDKKKPGRTPIALRVLKELVLPLAGGAAYGTLVAQAKQMPLDGVTAGGVAFFCILAAQGLVLHRLNSAEGSKRRVSLRWEVMASCGMPARVLPRRHLAQTSC